MTNPVERELTKQVTEPTKQVTELTADELESVSGGFTFKLVAVKTVSWAHDDEAPKETT
jgi:bacteriocin-like protein